jgi:tight adherence protein C
MSVGIFAAVFLLVVTLFGQTGEVRISPQREAAILTGHEDRRTVFEQIGIKRVMWLLLLVAHHLAAPGTKRWIQGKLVAAGSPNYYTAEEYLALIMLTGIMTALCAALFSVVVSGGTVSLLFVIIGFVLGIILAFAQLHEKAARRTREISRRTPYALDLISLAMGAGATFTEAVQTVVRDASDDPFNEELRALLAEMELGTTRRRALQNLADRVPLEAMRAIVSSVVQAEELGTPLATVLHAQANLLRQHRTVKAENTAAAASVKILLPSLLILIAVILTLFSPMILRAIQGKTLY